MDSPNHHPAKSGPNLKSTDHIVAKDACKMVSIVAKSPNSSSILAASPSRAIVAAGANTMLLARLIGFAQRVGQNIKEAAEVDGLDTAHHLEPFFTSLDNLLTTAANFQSVFPTQPLSLKPPAAALSTDLLAAPQPIHAHVAAAKALPVTDLLGRTFTVAKGKNKNETAKWGTTIMPSDAARTLIELLEGTRNKGTGVSTGYWNIVPAGTNVMGCWLSTTGQVNTTGHTHTSIKYGRPLGGKKPPTELVHRLPVLAWGSVAEIELLIEGDSTGKRYEVSHLCGQANCFKRDHISVETHGENSTRNRCQYGHESCRCRPPCLLVWTLEE